MSYKLVAFLLMASLGFATIVDFTNAPTVSLFFPTEFFDETTFFGNVTIHGWLNILSGELFVSSILAINGSSIPAIDDEFDLGNSTHRWRDLYLSNSFNVTNSNTNSSILGDLSVFGTIYGDVFTEDGGSILWLLNETGNTKAVELIDGNNNLTVQSDNATFLQDVTVIGTIFGGSPVEFGDDIIVDGDGTFNNINLLDGDASGNLIIRGNVTINGTTFINNTLNVTGLINGTTDCANFVGGIDDNYCDNIIPGLNVTGNITIGGNLTADFFYGEMFRNTSSAIDLTQDIFSNVTMDDSGLLNGFIFNNNNNTIQTNQTGTFQITYTISLEGTAGNSRVEVTASQNNNPLSKCTVFFEVGSNNPQGNSGTCIVKVFPGDSLGLVARNIQNNNDINVFFANFNMARIGN